MCPYMKHIDYATRHVSVEMEIKENKNLMAITVDCH